MDSDPSLVENPGEMTMPEDLHAVLALVAQRVHVMHMPFWKDDVGGSGGGDFDCAVAGLDPRWPFRLPPSWRLRQVLRYDITGWYWVLEHGGRPYAIDTLDDPDGIGRYGFPSGLAAKSEHELPGGEEAAYLTAKRVLKGIYTSEEWNRIAVFAKRDPQAFASSLRVIFGRRVADQLNEVVLGGGVPDPALARRARAAQRLRRIRTPARALRVLARSLGRTFQRIIEPTGMVAVVVGPDGSGKSAVAKALPEATRGFFRRHKSFHWRPGILPSPGALLGRQQRDPTDPHGASSRGTALSTALLLYYWLDFLLGTLLVVLPTKARSGLVVFERGWWDFYVDPRRYRLRVPRFLVRTLGRSLPRPDVVVVLEAKAGVIRDRKDELTDAAILEQSALWRDLGRSRSRFVFIDAARPLAEVIDDVRSVILDLAEDRTARRLGRGWVAFPSHRDPRWVIPRGPRSVTLKALKLYQPVTFTGFLGWWAARFAAAIGVFRVLPRGPAPTRAVIEKLRPHLLPEDHIALSRPTHTGRHIARLIRGGHEKDLIAKIATSGSGNDLKKEFAAIERARPLLSPPMAMPTARWSNHGVLLLQAMDWEPRLRVWHLHPDLAEALGVFYRRGGGGRNIGLAHGDLAPWNVLKMKASWCILDWENLREDAPVFFDLWHYLIQSHSLLGRPSKRTILRGLKGKGPVGTALERYSSGAGTELAAALPALIEYLKITMAELDLNRADSHSGADARSQLLRLLGAS